MPSHTDKLAPKPGFDWRKVTWGRPDSVVSALCSYCSAVIGDDEMPLRVWTPSGHAAQFCETCQAKWFGLETATE
jgi:hypothetical protein